MNWKVEQSCRSKQVDAIYKEISALEHKAKTVGSTFGIEIIREALEKETGLPVRIRHDSSANTHRLAIFKPHSTKKQIQYGRNILADMIVVGTSDRLSICTGKYDFIDMPELTEDIYSYMIERKKQFPE